MDRGMSPTVKTSSVFSGTLVKPIPVKVLGMLKPRFDWTELTLLWV